MTREEAIEIWKAHAGALSTMTEMRIQICLAIAAAENEACAKIVDPEPYIDIHRRLLENRAAEIRKRVAQ